MTLLSITLGLSKVDAAAASEYAGGGRSELDVEEAGFEFGRRLLCLPLLVLSFAALALSIP